MQDDEHIVELVRRAAEHDETAFGLLYTHYHSRIRTFLLQRLRNDADVDDLTAVTFHKAWQAIDRFEWRGHPFHSWLYQIAQNQYIDFIRDSVQDRKSEAACKRAYRPHYNDTSELEDRQICADMLKRLSDKQREVLYRRYVMQQESEEIAAIMNLNYGAIRALVMRGLDALRRCEESEHWLSFMRGEVDSAAPAVASQPKQGVRRRVIHLHRRDVFLRKSHPV